MSLQAKVLWAKFEVFDLHRPSFSRTFFDLQSPAQGRAGAANLVQFLLPAHDHSLATARHTERLSKHWSNVSPRHTKNAGFYQWYVVCVYWIGQRAHKIEDCTPGKLLAYWCDIPHPRMEDGSK
jgi:hypothetical protein